MIFEHNIDDGSVRTVSAYIVTSVTATNDHRDVVVGHSGIAPQLSVAFKSNPARFVSAKDIAAWLDRSLTPVAESVGNLAISLQTTSAGQRRRRRGHALETRETALSHHV